jgi:hypothetical protein
MIRTSRTTVGRARVGLAAAALVALAACDMGQFTVNTTAKVLIRAQPSLKMESDYELAARAIPGTLKTVEGFWVVHPENPILLGILTEGYCQYGIGFVEDEWERALIAKDFDLAQELDNRSSRMFLRCMNYALKQLGKKWQDGLFGDTESVAKLIASASGGKRTPLMWAGHRPRLDDQPQQGQRRAGGPGADRQGHAAQGRRARRQVGAQGQGPGRAAAHRARACSTPRRSAPSSVATPPRPRSTSSSRSRSPRASFSWPR